MSDDLGTDAGTGQPNAPAGQPNAPADEPQTDAAGAPIQRKQEAASSRPEAGPKEQPKKARTPDDDFDDYLKKIGGVKYTAKGKEKSVSTSADLKRLLASRDTTEEAVSAAARDKREAAELRATLANVARIPPRERLAALQAAGVDPRLLREAVEESILDEDERAKSQARLSPRERNYEAMLRDREEELTQLRERDERAKAEQEEAAYVQRVSQTGERLQKVAVGALRKAKISGAHATRFLGAIADRLDRNERLGLELDEGEIADSVMAEHGALADQFYSGLDLPALAERLEAAMVDDPDKPGSKVSRLRLLMRHEAARIRARQSGGAQQPARTQQPQPQGREMTLAEKMDAARTFGGGGS